MEFDTKSKRLIYVRNRLKTIGENMAHIKDGVDVWTELYS